MPIIYVDAANEGGTEDGSQSNPYGTIQEGINACSNGDVVDIAAGTYNENVTLSKSSVTLLGKLDAYDQPTVILEPPLVSLTWTLDETYGPGVYKTSDIPHTGAGTDVQPEILSYDGKTIARIRNDGGTNDNGWMGSDPDVDDWGWDALASTNPWNITSINNGTRTIDSNGGSAVDFWKGIYSIWGSLPDGSESYFRHKDGLNPNDLNIVVGAAISIGISIYGASYDNNTIDSIWVRGFDECIRIRLANTGNEVVRCKITNFSKGVNLYAPPENVTIHRNYFTTGVDGGGYMGSWSNTGYASEEYGLKEMTYEFWKYTYHESQSDSVAINLDDQGVSPTIQNNWITGTFTGIGTSALTGGWTGIDINNNRIENSPSTGFTLTPGSAGNIYQNTVFNCQSNFRYHDMLQDRASAYYIFNNISWQPTGVGTHVFFNFQSATTPTATRDYKTYHNTFSGGESGIAFATIISDTHGDHPDVEFLNNIFSVTYRPFLYVTDLPSKIGGTDAFDYNWTYGSNYLTENESEAWYGSNNIKNTTAPIWTQGTEPNPNFSLPDGHAAKNAAGAVPGTWPQYNALGADMGAYIVDGSTARPKVCVYSLGILT
jgi:hypothetical protein